MLSSNINNNSHHRNNMNHQQQQRNNNNNNNSNNIRCLQLRRIIQTSRTSFGLRRNQQSIWWTIIGLCCYIIIWFVAISDNSKSYNEIINFNHEKEIYQKKLEAKQIEIKRIMLEKQQKLREEKRNEGRLRGRTTTDRTDSSQQQHDNSNSQHKQKQNPDDIPPVFGLWASMMIMLSYYRIRMEPRLRRRMMEQQQLQQQQQRGRGRSPLSRSEQQEAVVRSLRRINQERISNGQETISLESYQAFQHLLMTDRSIWRVLATTRPQQSQQRPVGATSEELERCPIHTIPDNYNCIDHAGSNNNNTCSICLTSFQSNESIRTLVPCRHTFHQNCIDRWLQQSILCPICKTSIAINNANNTDNNDADNNNLNSNSNNNTIINNNIGRQQRQRSTQDILDDAIMIGNM